jgi:hypothetical protein
VNLDQFKGERILGGMTSMLSILQINKSSTDAYANNCIDIVKVYVDVVNVNSASMVKIIMKEVLGTLLIH